jgi:hypothetical protein
MAIDQLYGPPAIGRKPWIMGHHQYCAAELGIDAMK